MTRTTSSAAGSFTPALLTCLFLAACGGSTGGTGDGPGGGAGAGATSGPSAGGGGGDSTGGGGAADGGVSGATGSTGGSTGGGRADAGIPPNAGGGDESAGLGDAGVILLPPDWPDGGTPCDDALCSGRGACAYQGGFTSCTCEPGYRGVICSACDVGFHKDATDACVADDVCADDTCGDHGTCRIASGRVACDCAAGWGGIRCGGCAPGFHDDGGECVLDQVCLPNACSGRGDCSVVGGLVRCACDAGFAGDFCERGAGTCAANDPCVGEHGVCVEASGFVRCACDPGYTGVGCDTCYPGFVDLGAGCELAFSCDAASCSGAGACDDATGVAVCTCDTGYEGSACERCADGFHRDVAAWRCVRDVACADLDPCGEHGTCVDTGGVVRCQCDEGWAGAACESCYPGYHLDAGACVLDARCFPATCRFHGRCEEVDSAPRCTCDAGFSGARCEVDEDGCASNACGAGRCLDVGDENVCLCPDDTYGATCGEN